MYSLPNMIRDYHPGLKDVKGPTLTPAAFEASPEERAEKVGWMKLFHHSASFQDSLMAEFFKPEVFSLLLGEELISETFTSS